MREAITPQPETLRGARIAFWILAGAGIPVMVLTWSWYGLAHLEAETEQGKALNAGTTMEGTAEVLGGIPLVFGHVVGLVLLLIIGWYGWRVRGLAFGVLAVVLASGIGIGAAQMLFCGELFEVGLGRYYDQVG